MSVSYFWEARILISSCLLRFLKKKKKILIVLFILCRLASLQLLKTLEAKLSRPLYQPNQNPATKRSREVTQQFRWLLIRRLSKVVKCQLKKKSKTWQWLQKASRLPAWSRTQHSSLMNMRKTVTPLPLQIPAVFPPRRSSEKKTPVCVHFFFFEYSQPEFNDIYYSSFLFTVETLTFPSKEELLDVDPHIKNSTLLDASHAVSIHMHQPPNLSTIIGNSLVV